MAHPFYYEESSEDRLQSLVGWRISPVCPGVVITASPNVQSLDRHITDLVLELDDGQIVSANLRSKPRNAKKVFIKCSYIHCADVKPIYAELIGKLRVDCSPFTYPRSLEALQEIRSLPGFVFLLHNHNTTATIGPKSNGFVAPQCSVMSVGLNNH